MTSSGSAADLPVAHRFCFSSAGQICDVTDGLAVLAAWVMFGLLLAALAFVVLRGGERR